MDGHQRHSGGQRDVKLFGGYYLSTAEACALIRAYSGADVIREWQGIAPTPAAQDGEAREGAGEGTRGDVRVWYAGVRMRSGDHARGRSRTIVGRGHAPHSAIEDLVWKLVAPRLLADDGL